MKRFLAAALPAALSAALYVTPSAAQDATAPDATRLELARKLVDASGASRNAEATVDQFYGFIDQLLAKSATASTGNLFAAIRADMKLELRAMMPGLLDESVKIYACNLTEKELSDLVTWQTSESGQSINRKLTVITQEILKAEVPYIQAMMPRLMQRAVDHACDEAKCSPQLRQDVASAIAQSAPKAPS